MVNQLLDKPNETELLPIVYAIGLTVLTALARAFINRKFSLVNSDSKSISRIVIGIVLVISSSLMLIGFCAGFLDGLLDGDGIKVKLENGLESDHMIKVVNVLQVVSGLFAILLWIGAYIIAKIIINYVVDQLNRSRLNANLKQAQLNTLKGQINPHFMFNSLNNIRGLMLEDVQKSREMITKLSEVLRYSLNSHKLDTIPLQEEIETINNYIQLSKIQLEDHLQYQENITADVLDVEIPPMIIQMLIENAIKHGIADQVNGGRVILSIQQNQDSLHIVVNNTGRLKEHTTSSTKIGIKNIKERLQLLYGEHAFLTLKQLDGSVEASLKIPIYEN
ncbi:hypothetical protein GCM10022393_10500 [Aquimarina addita]|uniref:Signal transduction histidine kinase internal region domain-containing protein n=2 Tax=Aquimarina addita TaxID=870485 RepID=A0ABP7XE99_9FLAO